MNKKGNAAMVWLVVLISIFVCGLVWIITDNPFTTIKNKLTPGMTVEHQTTVNKIDTVWKNWPVVFILGMILWGVIATIRDRSATAPPQF